MDELQTFQDFHPPPGVQQGAGVRTRGDALLLAAGHAALHGVADDGVGADVQAQHMDDELCNHAVLSALHCPRLHHCIHRPVCFHCELILPAAQLCQQICNAAMTDTYVGWRAWVNWQRLSLILHIAGND